LDNYRTEVIPDPEGKKQRAGFVGFVVDVLETFLLALILFFGINAVTDRVRVDNISMMPTLQPGEFVLVNKIAYKIGEPARGDVITFHYPRNPAENYIKRVIGLPGDRVAVRDGKVFVNDHELTEPYISAPPAYANDWTVPEESLFVLGDNRNQSSDSHSWGYVPMDYVIGKAEFIYWPLEEINLLSYPNIVRASP
jgi:signal peptidase I